MQVGSVLLFGALQEQVDLVVFLVGVVDLGVELGCTTAFGVGGQKALCLLHLRTLLWFD